MSEIIHLDYKLAEIVSPLSCISKEPPWPWSGIGRAFQAEQNTTNRLINWLKTLGFESHYAAQLAEHWTLCLRSHFIMVMIIIIKLCRSESHSVGWALIRLNLKDSTTLGSLLFSILNPETTDKSADYCHQNDSLESSWQWLRRLRSYSSYSGSRGDLIVLIYRRSC